MAFEEALNRLNEISALMDDPKITLKEAVELYSEANKLAEQCEKELNEAKLSLEEIKSDV